jgi:hypothetical protein
MLSFACVGGRALPSIVARQATWGASGDVLVQLGVRAIPLGIAAMVLGFILKSAGTQAGPADTGSPGISVFGTIHPDIFRLRTPLGSGPARGGLQLASLEPQVGSDAPAIGFGMLAETAALPCRLDERFAKFDDRPASFDQNRFTSADHCTASFEDRFASAMPVRAIARRSAPELDVEDRRADTLQTPAFMADARPGEARKQIASPQDDGRTAIYDITAHTVYLPSGRRLEAHSGLGGLLDNPRHVSVRMRGATPPNVYDLALRERMFHGVRAIRLKPVDDGRMHGRDGILAHSYMLGPGGQSNGCVVFSNYPEFLNAFLKGEVTRLAVVDRLESPPDKLAAGQLPEPVRELLKATDRSRQYAAAGDR